MTSQFVARLSCQSTGEKNLVVRMLVGLILCINGAGIAQRYLPKPILDRSTIRERMRVVTRQAFDEYEAVVNGRPQVSSCDDGSEHFVTWDQSQTFPSGERASGFPLESSFNAGNSLNTGYSETGLVEEKNSGPPAGW